MAKDSFTHWRIEPGVSLNGFFHPGESRCGIYILEFENGERYVGQAVDVVNRFATHRRHYDDIVAIQFRAVPREDLSPAERQTVQTNRDAGRHLRNINLVNTSWAGQVPGSGVAILR